MADNPWDADYSAPAPAPSSKAPWEENYSTDKHPAAQSGGDSQGVLETGARALAGSAVKTAAIPAYLAGGLVGAVGAQDTADRFFRAYENVRAKGADIEGAAPKSIGGRVAQFVGALPVGVATLGAEGIVEPGAEVVRRGGTIREAEGQTALNTAATAATLGVGKIGKTVAQRVIGQGLTMGALNEGARVAGNAMRGPDEQQEFDPVELGLNVGAGAAFGLVPHGEAKTPQPTPADAAAAKTLESGVDAHMAQPALPAPGARPDFVVNPRGEAAAPNPQDVNFNTAPNTGGAGFEAQTPEPVGPPKGPLEAAARAVQPLQLGHEPDVTVDTRGRAVVNKGDRTLGEPFGGTGLTEPARRPTAMEAAFQRARVAQSGEPPEAAANAPATPAEPQAPAGAAAQPVSLLDRYNERQAQVDALNTKRKAGALSETENDQLHDLNEQQSQTNPVSGMPNKRALDAAMASGKYTHAAAIDIDDFKQVNDNFGHGAGDQLLQTVGQNLAETLGDKAAVFHLSGDEYAAAGGADLAEHVKRAQGVLDKQPITVHWIDKQGRPVDHTFSRIGLSFGVGEGEHAYQQADLASQSDKEARRAAGIRSGRRSTDTGPAAAAESTGSGIQSDQRSADTGLQTAAGGDVPGVQLPARGTVPEGQAAGGGAEATRNDVASGTEVSPAERAPVTGEPSAGLPTRGDQNAPAPRSGGALVDEGAAQPRAAAAPTPKEQRLTEAYQHHIANLGEEIGWDQVGGRLLRAPLKDGEGALGEVTDRTAWVGKQGPMGESALWRTRPDKALKESQARDALRKAAVGEKLTPIEQRFVAHAQRIARTYAEHEEAARQDDAERRGFDSVEAMHEHDATIADKEWNDFINTPSATHGNEIPFSRNKSAAATPSGVPKNAKASIDSNSESLSRGITRYVNANKAPGQPRQRAEFRSIRQEALPDALHSALSALERATGTKVNVVRNLTPHVEDFEGVTFGDRVLHVNADSQHPLTVVASHEFLHDLRNTHPELYAQLADEVRRQGLLPEWMQSMHRAGYRGISKEGAIEELTANATGDAMTDPTFLREIAKRNPSVFRQVADAFIRFIDGFLGNFRNYESNRYLNDVKAFRDKLANVLEQYQPKRGGEAGNAAFSKRSGGASADMFGAPEPAKRDEAAPRPQTADLFGGASTKDHVDAAVRAKEDALRGGGKAPTMRQGEGELFAGGRPEQAKFSRSDEDKVTIGYPGDRLVHRDRLAQRKFDKPYAKLDADEKADVDALLQTTSASKNAMFSKADKQDQPQVESEAFKKWSNNAPLIDRHAADTHAFKTGERIVVEAYHGTQRPDRVGDIFKRGRATSGPMAFFTSDPELASTYAKGKSDTSLANEDSAYETWFKFQPKGSRSPVSIDRAWYRLSDEQRQRIGELAGRVMEDDDGHIILADKDSPRAGSGLGGYDQHIKETRGNHLKALVEEWLNSGALFNDEGRFEEVLSKAGMDTRDVKFDSPHAEYPFVYKTFIKMQRPLVTTDMPASVMAQLERAAKFDRKQPAQYGADAWDKNTRGMRDWIAQLRRPEDHIHAWTSIPDKVTKTLEAMGYDGIVDQSGKLGGAKHPVYIPFRETQVKSAISNKGTFDESKKNIRFSKSESAELKTAADSVEQSAKDSRENARNDVRSSFAESERHTGTADAALRTFRNAYDKLISAYKGDPRKLYASISELEKGGKVDDPLANEFWRASSALIKEQHERLTALGAQIAERANYFSHIWKNQGRAAEEDLAKAKKEEAGQFMGGRRPLSGNKAFTKERVFETMLDGINAGREPISNNPVDMFMARYAQGEKLAAALTIKQAFGERGFLKETEGDRVPPGYQRVNDGVFAGKVLPELIARDLNNHLDPGLSKFKGWRSFRYVQNLMLSARLGLSAFHAGMTTLDQIATHINIGARKAADGDLRGALNDLFHATKAPLTTIQELAGKGAGSKLVRQWFGKEAADANTTALLNMLQEGGARAHMSSTDWNDSLVKFRRAWTQGDIRTATLNTIPAAVEATTYHIAHNLVPAQKMTARVLMLKFELDRLAGQLGTAKGDYAATIDKLAPDAMRQISRKINADVDDRLGQFAYDNEFWNKTIKDAAHASIQSVGWNFGSLRLLGGGARDLGRLAKPEAVRGPLDKAGNIQNAKLSRLTGRLSYLITLNAVVATMGAMTQLALTGQGPEESKDYFFPKTGRQNSDGTDERLAFPSYVKDEYAFFGGFNRGISAGVGQALQTAQHKLHPALSMLAEMATNKDYYGNQLWNPDDSLPTEAKQFIEYLGRSFVPYSLQGAQRNANAGNSAAMTALPFIGVTPAPGDITRSKFQNFVKERYNETPEGQRYKNQTPEQQEHSKQFFDALSAARAGEKPDLSKLTAKDRNTIHFLMRPGYNSFSGHFGKLDINAQLHAYELATPAERSQYKLRHIILKGSAAKLRALPADERQDVQKRVNDVVRGAQASE